MAIPLSDAHNSAWRLFLTAHTVLVNCIEQELAQANLPPLAWYDVLWALEQAPGQRLRLSELADALVLQRSNLTRLVDRLENADLVRRQVCDTDRRGAFAEITPEGLAMRQRIWQVYETAIAKYFATSLSNSTVEMLTQSLNQMLVNCCNSKV
jgi:DNA-binding MarR family transcriptional regulator